jgi:hypothetical protein
MPKGSTTPGKQNTVWCGTRDLAPLKVNQRYNAEKVIITTGWTGPYDTCRARVPAIGQTIQGFNFNNLRVSEVELVELDGDAGEIRVTIESPGTSLRVDDASYEPIGESVFEMEWMELQKPLETHPEMINLASTRPRYDADGNVSPTGRQRTWDDWAELTDDDVGTGLGITLAKYKEYREAGVESFIVYQPVARRTTHYIRGGIQTGKCGIRIPPPVGCGAPEGYQWLKTADRVSRSGRTTARVEEWTGAEKWDTTLYPAT